MARIPVIIDTKEKGAKKATKNIKGLSGSLGGLAKSAALASGAFLGAGALVAGLKAATAAAAEQELAEKKLRFAAGDLTDELIKQAQALQQNTIFGDEAIISQQAYLASLGLTGDQIKDTISASLDLAAATGMSLESAVMNTSKTLSGMAGELGEKLGPAFRELTPEALKAGEGIKFIAEQFGGTAQAEVETMAGSMAQAKNAIGDAAEAIGNLLSPAVILVSNTLKLFAEGIGDLIGWRKEFIEMAKEAKLLTDSEIAISNFKNQIKDLTKDEAIEQLKKLGVTFNDTGESIGGITGIVNDELENQNLKIKALIEVYNNAREGLSDFDNKLAEFTQQQKDRLTNQKEETKILDEFIKRYPIIAKELNLLTEAQKLKNEEEAKGRAQAKSDEEQAEERKAKDKQTESDRIADLKQSRKDEAKKFVSNMQVMGKQFPAMEKASKRAAQVQALVDAYASANAAYKAMAGIPVVGPALGIAAAAAAVGAGLANVKQIEAAATGADFVTSGPQMMMVGDNPSGMERVQVTPLGGDPNINGPQGGAVNITFNSPLMDSQHTEDVIIPQIKEAIRRGADIGVS